MHNTLAMTIDDGAQYLIYHIAGMDLGRLLLFDHIVQQLASRAELRDHDDKLILNKVLIRLHNVGMRQMLDYLDLSHQAFKLIAI